MVVSKNNTDNLDNISTSDLKQDEKDERCAPKHKFEHGSCIPLNLLIKMAEAYNDMKINNPIILQPSLATLNPPLYKKKLIKQFNDRFKDVCKDQRCWMKQEFIKRLNGIDKEELIYNTFRPKGPKGKTTWLNTNNIDEVMAQYESIYSDFKYLGTVPMDFDDLPQLGIRDLDFNDLETNHKKTKIGVVFNLDKSTGPGTHWVSLYSDFNKGCVYFFDSYGIEPTPEVRKLMRRIARYIRDVKNKDPTVDHNRVRHQYKDSECGVYSISFILRLLKGIEYNTIINNPVADDDINKCRNVYFT